MREDPPLGAWLLPQRPNELRGTAARDATIRESCSPRFSGRWGREPSAEAIIFYILSILHIPSKQFP